MNQPLDNIDRLPAESDGGSGLNIDYKRVLMRAMRYWYIVVFSLAVSLAYSYFKTRYTVFYYTVNASVLIKERSENNSASILYQNVLIDAYRNYMNEPYILRSLPLMESVVRDLNFEVAYFQEGNIKRTEVYGMPVKIRLLQKNGSYGVSLIFEAINESTFSIKTNKESQPQLFRFGDSVHFQNHYFYVEKDLQKDIRPILHSPYTITFLDPMGIAASYSGRLGVVWAEEGTAVLNLSVTGNNAEKELAFMRGLVNTYQQYDLDKKNQKADGTIRFIRSQLKVISDSLRFYEIQLQRFKHTNSTQGYEAEIGKLYNKVDEFVDQKANLIFQSYYYDYAIKYIHEGKNLDLIMSPASLGISDPLVSGLVSKLVDAQLGLRMFADKGHDGNPLFQAELNKVNEIKSELVKTINNLRVADEVKKDVIDKKIKSAEEELSKLPQLQSQYLTIRRNYELQEGLYTYLQQKMSESAISKASNVSDIVLVNPPTAAGPFTAGSANNYLFGLVVGLLIPFGIFTLMEVINQRVQSKEDMEKLTTIPFIGGIGHSILTQNLVVIERPKSPLAESFRAIRSNLNYFTGNQVKKVFMVTSSISGEGKTFTTVNLATVFAMSGRRTLIIGADMRKPKIYADFDLNNRVGLSSYLSGLNTLSEIIQPTKVNDLDLISGGPVPPNPSELLLTEKFDELLKEALVIYDYIIIDTPPMAIVTDGFVIASRVDHTIFVVRQNVTPRIFLKNIDEFYVTAKLKKVSIVLNDIYRSGLGYGYGNHYGYGYGYGYTYGKNRDGDGYYTE